MKRLVLAAACAAGFLVLPSAASAAIHQIEINEEAATYCVALDNGPTAVTFTVRTPAGGLLDTVRTTTHTASQNCDGGPTPGAGSYTAALDASRGSTVTADAGGGLTTSFPVPFGSYDAVSGTGIVKLAGLPTSGGSALINGVAHGYSGSTYATPSPISVGTGEVELSSTINGIPFSVLFQTEQFSVQATYDGSISLYGGSPLGSPILVSVSGGGVAPQGTTISPAVDHNQLDETRLSGAIPGGSVVTVSQPGWFTHTVTSGTVTASSSGVSIAVPAVDGETATASDDLNFVQTSPPSPSSGLGCLELGNAAHMLSACSSAVARYSATFPVLFAPGDDFSVELTEPDGDRATTELRGSGLLAFPQGGAIDLSALGRSAGITLTGTSPTGSTASVFGATDPEGGAYFGGEGGASFLPMRLVTGTSIVASGAAVGSPHTYLVNLETRADASTVSGTTYPGGHVAVSHGRPAASGSMSYATADASGAFSVDVGAILPRDSIVVYATDAAATVVTQRSFSPESPQPAIQGLVDQQLVHGTISVSATGGGPSGIFWAGDGSPALASAAPFAYSLDTTQLRDGSHRISAMASGLYSGLGDYVWVRVDNTAPVVTAGSDQTSALGNSVAVLADGHDANGMAALSVSFGDGTTIAQPVAQIGQPLRHAYAKGGTYTETVTGTDNAGNVATATASIHVISKLSEQVRGKVPATFKQAKKLKKRKNLSVKFVAQMAGVLNVRVLNSASKVRASSNLRFAAANAKATLTVATKKWAKGRYLVVLQFTDANGVAGPVVLQPLRIK